MGGLTRDSKINRILSNRTQNNINRKISYLSGTENLRLHHLRHSLGSHFSLSASPLNSPFFRVPKLGGRKVNCRFDDIKIKLALLRLERFVNEILSLRIPDQFRFAFTRLRARVVFLFL